MVSRVDKITKRSVRNHLTHFLPADRLSEFADGVFAIVITLLVLELPVPEATEDLLWALLEEWPDFLAYIISFVFIGGLWITHSSITQMTEKEDGITFRMTLVMLFFISLLPFSTSLMAKHLTGPGSHLSVLIYGLNLLIASIHAGQYYALPCPAPGTPRRRPRGRGSPSHGATAAIRHHSRCNRRAACAVPAYSGNRDLHRRGTLLFHPSPDLYTKL